jgi:hypothetical protein
MSSSPAPLALPGMEWPGLLDAERQLVQQLLDGVKAGTVRAPQVRGFRLLTTVCLLARTRLCSMHLPGWRRAHPPCLMHQGFCAVVHSPSHQQHYTHTHTNTHTTCAPACE